jgi:hypothetical protein
MFFENNCGAKPPSNKYINKGEEPKLTEGLKRGRGKRAPYQQLGLREVYKLSHLIFCRKPNASHMCARIKFTHI